MTFKEDLELITRYQKEIVLIGKAAGLMHWDQETNMPKKGVEARAENVAFLAGLAHEKRTSEEFFEAAKRLQKNRELKEDDKIMLKRLLKDLEKSRTLSKEFVEELKRTSTKARAAWMEAREKKDFKIFRPHLEKIIELKRKEASYYKFPGHIYNGLLDDYEEGMTVEELKPKFAELKECLVALLNKIESSEKYKKQKHILTKKDFPKELQMELVKDVVKRMGLEDNFSRIDFSEHPFTIDIGLNDIRITTNIRSDPLFSFGSSIHEAGHALYMLGLPEEHFYNALGDSPSHGVHESQSRFWENMIGKSKNFWRFYFPKFSKKFDLGDNWKEWYDEINFVTPGKIRIEGDEVHYCLHIILRFEIELGLLDGSIKVSDLPEVWNNKMKELFGVIPENDKEGVLQDSHWSGGSFGYFPTYALGTIYATQLYKAILKENPKLEEEIQQGDFSKIGKWLHKKIHRHGKRYIAEELIKKTCGKGLNIKDYIDYLNKKYSEIYNLS
ncbi:MAG: carboxypeptidase M32 [Nanoarchaeota archaeon]